MPEIDRYLQRLEKLQSSLDPGHVIVLCQPSDICYFTGLQVITQNEREAFLVISHHTSHLFVAAFTPLPGFLENLDTQHLTVTHSLQIYGIITAVQQSALRSEAKTIFFDEQHLFMAEANEVKKGLAASSTTEYHYESLDRSLIWKLRQQKDAFELKELRKACDIVSQSLRETLESLQIGETEQAIALRLETQMRQLGAKGPAFPTIVAFGAHAALPHYQPGDTPLTANTAVLIDCGANVNGYNSDMTRTVWFGQDPSAEFLKIETSVKNAYEVGKKLLLDRMGRSAGLKVAEIDKNVRESIEKDGCGKFFIHTTGHGIGLEVHEPPSVYLTSHASIEPNMIITIEPGIYLPGQLGYRHENTVLITSQGAEELTQ